MVIEMASTQVLASATNDGTGIGYYQEQVKSLVRVVDDMRMPGDVEDPDLKDMKRLVREIFVREEALLTKSRILQVLTSGAGAEVKLVSDVLLHIKIGKQRVEEMQKQQETAINLLTREKDDLLSTTNKLRDERHLLKNTVNVLTKERDGLLSTASALREALYLQVDAINAVVKERDELMSTACALRDEVSSKEVCINAVMRERDEVLSMVAKVRDELDSQKDGTIAITKERDEHLSSARALDNELSSLKRLHEERGHMYELQRREMEEEFKERLGSLQCQLEDSVSKFHKFETGSVSRLRELEQRDALYEKWLDHLLTATRGLRLSSVSSKGLVLGLQHEFERRIRQLSVQMQELGKQAEGYQTLFAENRRLYNEVLDLKGNIRVYCRVRPSVHGVESGTVDYIGNNGDIMIVNPNKQGRDTRRNFNFHQVFGSTASQEDVYLGTQPFIRSVLDGYNVCIFAYGQTGSGKTYTMSGPNGSALDTDVGVNYRALTDLFMITESRREACEYEIGVQMIEIYNEQVRDLLSAPGSLAKKLEIRNHHSQLNVPDACLMSVISKDDVLELMKIGGRNRAVGATALNERSSRSHCVLTVHVQGLDLSTGTLLRGSLHLVDLAGSERIDKSEVTGERLKEALHINRSLSALGDVIAALAQKSAHVPYRNSKLTQLLQDSLGGQGKALMVVHVNAESESFGETISTLKFAERVATVELGVARSNKEPGEVRELKEQILNLKDMNAQKEAELERLRALAVDDAAGMRTPSKMRRPVGITPGPAASRRLSKDSLLGRRIKPSPEGGFGSANGRFI